jgi:AcrR family transcriptional regulator
MAKTAPRAKPGESATNGDTVRRRRVGGLDADQRRERRRQQILEAAKTLFADQGYLSTSIEQLSQAANVSTKSFYEVFSSREDCYVSQYEELGNSLRARMTERVQSLPDSEEDASALLMTAFVDALVADLRGAQILLGHARLVAPAVDRLRRDNRRWTADYVEALWKHYGSAGNHHSIAVAFVGGMFDLITNWLIADDVTKSATIRALTTDLLHFYEVVRRGVGN